MTRMPVWALAAALCLPGCMTERPPDELHGQLHLVGSRYRVTACGTDDSFELRLSTPLRVNLDRRVEVIEAEAPGPVLGNFGGRSLPPTREIAPTRIFDVWKVGVVERGACP